MYVRYKTGKGFTNLIKYQFKDEREEPARIIGTNVPSDSPERLIEEFEQVAGLKPRVRSPVMHAIVSWHPDEQLDDEKMAEVGKRLLASVDLPEDQHQFILVRHEDTKHPHMHIVANRVGFDGRVQDPTGFPAVRMRNEATKLDIENGFKTGQAALASARKRGLDIPATAQGVAPSRDATRNAEEMNLMLREGKTAKHEVYTGVREALAESDGSFANFDWEIRKRGIAPSWSFNAQGGFNGASFTLLSSDASHPLLQAGQPETPFMGRSHTFKGSQLGPKPGLSKDYLLKALDGRREALDRRAAKQRTRDELREVRRAEAVEFQKALRSQQGGSGSMRRYIVGRSPANLSRVIAAYTRPISHSFFFRTISLFSQQAVPRFSIPRSAFSRPKGRR